MLVNLTIKNYALIRHLEMSPSPNLTVITGETGAGKSIMLGAVGLLLGSRADTKVLWDEKEKCVSEGVFEIKTYKLQALFEELKLDYQDETIIRREIIPGGKSRAFVNDTPVTLEVMRTLGRKLMDVHSQHETLELGNLRFQLSLIDSYAGNSSIYSKYKIAWEKYLQSKHEHEKLKNESERLKNEFDFVKFQLEELENANLQNNELEDLESNLKIADRSQDIKTRLNQILHSLSLSDESVISQLNQATGLMNPIRSLSPEFEQITQRLSSTFIELKDILQDLEQLESSVEFDSENIILMQQRLDAINGLLLKHRVQKIEDLLKLKDSYSVQAEMTINLDESLIVANKNLEDAKLKLSTLAKELTDSRMDCLPKLKIELVRLLKNLGIMEASIDIVSSNQEMSHTGSDKIEILFSANKGIAPRPIQEVASGGEFSRLMFCVKYIMAEKVALPTLVLDEIDTGVSGEIAIQLAKMMKDMAGRHQIIAISHLTQIAARADSHFLVYKNNSTEKTTSEIKLLTETERIEEIAKMIGGQKPSAVAFENAKELVNGRT